MFTCFAAIELNMNKIIYLQDLSYINSNYLSYEFIQMLILFLYHGESSVDTRAFPSAPPVMQVPD